MVCVLVRGQTVILSLLVSVCTPVSAQAHPGFNLMGSLVPERTAHKR